jgi:hypothetical protein
VARGRSRCRLGGHAPHDSSHHEPQRTMRPHVNASGVLGAGWMSQPGSMSQPGPRRTAQNAWSNARPAAPARHLSGESKRPFLADQRADGESSEAQIGPACRIDGGYATRYG